MSGIDVSVNVTDSSFNQPWGIAFDNSGNYYVSNYTKDSSGNFISKMSSSGVFTLEWANTLTNGQLTGLAYSSYNGHLYCANFLSCAIYKINTGNGFVNTYTTLGSIYRPLGVATYGNYLYVSTNSGYIYRYDLSIFIPSAYTFYTNNPSLNTIFAITFDNQGYLYSLYSDVSYNYYVNKINESSSVVMSFNYSNFVATIGTTLNYNSGLVCDSDYNIYISNIDNKNIARYDSSGTLITLNYINDVSYNVPRGLAIQNNYLYSIDSNVSGSTGGTVYKGVEPSCFNFDTKILCLNNSMEEEYIPIQNLKSGDLVKTYLHGYRRIDLIGKISFANNPNKWNHSMYKMVKTEENSLFEDLIVTGGHSILLDEFTESEKKKLNKLGIKEYEDKIDDKYLLLASASDQFVKLTGSDIYTCYHFVLETNGNDDKQFGIWANGILTETTSKNYFKTQNYTLL